MSAIQKRQIAKKNSSLPYSFEYKIREAFYGEQCPICKTKMERHEFGNKKIPSIQHNIPLSKGGAHEVANISVICRSCNTSVKDNITGNLNSRIVAKVWDKIIQKGINNGN